MTKTTPNVKWLTLPAAQPCKLRGVVALPAIPGIGEMRAKSQVVNCDFCSRGRIVPRSEEISFRQRSDRGLVNCRAWVTVGVCDHCGAGSLEPGADRIFDEAFRREYARHAGQMSAG